MYRFCRRRECVLGLSQTGMSSSQYGRVCQYACVRWDKDVYRKVSVRREEVEIYSQQASARAPAPIFILVAVWLARRRRSRSHAPQARVVGGSAGVVQDAGRVGRSSRQADCQSCTSRCSRRRLALHGVKRAVMIARVKERRAVGHLSNTLTNSVCVLACPRCRAR